VAASRRLIEASQAIDRTPVASASATTGWDPSTCSSRNVVRLAFVASSNRCKISEAGKRPPFALGGGARRPVVVLLHERIADVERDLSRPDLAGLLVVAIV
jgi:hypothetical protein